MFEKSVVVKFYRQVKVEVLKVVWPTRKELFTATVIVVVTVLICSLICLMLDYAIHSIVNTLLSIGK